MQEFYPGGLIYASENFDDQSLLTAIQPNNDNYFLSHRYPSFFQRKPMGSMSQVLRKNSRMVGPADLISEYYVPYKNYQIPTDNFFWRLHPRPAARLPSGLWNVVNLPSENEDHP